MGEKGRQIVITDEGKFDPDSIPKKKWEDYQAELWDAQTQRDDTHSEASGYSYGTKSYHAAASIYGDQVSNYPGSRPMSQLELAPPYQYNASRLSLAPSEMLGGGGAPGVHTSASVAAEMEMSDLTGMPSDDALLGEIREILRTADLMTVTKKGIKTELERRFGVPLDSKRAYIGSGKFRPVP
jgi:chitin synthase